MRKIFLFLLITPLFFNNAISKEGKGRKYLYHDRYTGILYADDVGSCVPGGTGTGTGGPTEPPIPPMPPKSFQTEGRIGIIAFNRGRVRNKIAFHLRTKGLEDITGVHLHCRDIAGNDSGVGVTLKKSGWFNHGWQDAAGYIRKPDEGNNCEWNNLDDIHSAIDRGEVFVRVNTLLNPDGELSGNIHCIGFEESDWL